MRNLEIEKGKNSSGRRAYKFAVETNLFGVRDKIKEARKNPNKRKFNKRNKR